MLNPTEFKFETGDNSGDTIRTVIVFDSAVVNASQPALTRQQAPPLRAPRSSFTGSILFCLVSAAAGIAARVESCSHIQTEWRSPACCYSRSFPCCRPRSAPRSARSASPPSTGRCTTATEASPYPPQCQGMPSMRSTHQAPWGTPSTGILPFPVGFHPSFATSASVPTRAMPMRAVYG